MSFSDQNLSIVRRCRRRKLFTFSSSSPEPLGHFQPNLAQSILGCMGFQVCSNEGPCPFSRGDNYEIVKIHWRNLKIFFSRTTEPISTKLGTKHPWVKGIQVCSNEGSRHFPRGDNYEIVKIHWRNLKIFLFRTTGPISTKLAIKHPWVKGIQLCSNEEPHPFPRGNYYEIVKIHWRCFVPSLVENGSVDLEKKIFDFCQCIFAIS